ncbi:MAG: 30S ribosomal protein S6 [Rudaea sp.]
MPSYELTYVLRPLDEAALAATTERINNLIATSGGEVVARNDWGRRRLAYPIKKVSEGIYASLQLNLPPTAVRPVERALQLNDDVLRYLVVRMDEHQTVKPPEAQKETS